MAIREVVPGVYQISFGFVSAYLVDSGGLTLIDTGINSSAPKIWEGLRQIGRTPRDIHAIILTHLHGDHIGSAKAIQQASGAKVYMHPLDAADYQNGHSIREVQSAPGLLNHIIVGFMRSAGGSRRIDPARVDVEISDGQILGDAGGLTVIHTPGHTTGHVALLWPEQGGVLFAGDACGNMFGLADSILYENYLEGQNSLKKLSALKFNTACFAHGKSILNLASDKFHQKWGMPA